MPFPISLYSTDFWQKLSEQLGYSEADSESAKKNIDSNDVDISVASDDVFDFCGLTSHNSELLQIIYRCECESIETNEQSLPEIEPEDLPTCE